jgi:aldose 1-epimerase
LVDQEISKEGAMIVLRYIEQPYTKGFPDTYVVDLKYTLTKDSLNLSVSVKNAGAKTFPFTMAVIPILTVMIYSIAL